MGAGGRSDGCQEALRGDGTPSMGHSQGMLLEGRREMRQEIGDSLLFKTKKIHVSFSFFCKIKIKAKKINQRSVYCGRNQTIYYYK